MRKLLVIILLLTLLLPTSANAARQSAFTLSSWQVNVGQGHKIIENQTWYLNSVTPDPNHTIINPDTCCSWDINDHSELQSNTGYLDPGASTNTGTVFQHIFEWNPIYSCRPMCAEWSGNKNWFGATVMAPRDSLIVSVCFQPQNRCFTANTHFDKNFNDYIYNFCGQIVYNPGDPAIVDIPGSNGGMGVPTTMILTVTNPTSRSIRDITAKWGMSSDIIFGHGCPDSSPTNIGSPYIVLQDYPFRWVSNF